MGDLKFLAKNEKELKTLVQIFQNLQPKHRNRIWHGEMSNAGNEQGKKDNQERKLNKLTRKSPGHPMGVGGGVY